MSKKAKKKSAKEQKQNTVPTEWVGKSAEQLKELVVGLQCDLEKARKSRNNAQTEFASIQSYYDITRENIRELDMRIEKQDLEVENTEEDNETELNVYEQKSNFVKYCHDKQLKQAKEETDSRTADSIKDHANQVESTKASTANLEAEKDELEKRLIDDFSSTRTQQRNELTRVKEQLDADVRLFEQHCEAHQSFLKKELSTRRTSELHAIESRKESHLKDIIASHERACGEMRSYFDGVERQQSIDIEELQAQIRRLKKVAVKHESDSNYLKESNRVHGDELQLCSDKVSNLKSQTNDMEKDRISLSAANARLSATRKAIRESRDEYKELQQKVETVREVIDGVKKQMTELNCKCSFALHVQSYLFICIQLLLLHHCVASSVIGRNAAKREALQESLERQLKKNDIIDQHLGHVSASAGLTGDASASKELMSNISDFINETNKEIEKLTVKIAQAKDVYTVDLNNFRTVLKNCGACAEDIDSIHVKKI
jgi:chromosome segregation ATPase